MSYIIRLRRAVLNHFLSVAAATPAYEQCALFTGSPPTVYNTGNIEVCIDNIHWIENISDTRRKEFVMEPKQVLNITKSGLFINGIIHSHVNNIIVPSEQDINNLKQNRFCGAYIITDTMFRYNLWFHDRQNNLQNQTELILVN